MSQVGPNSQLFTNFNKNNIIYIIKAIDDNEARIIGASFSYETAKQYCKPGCIIESIPMLPSTTDFPTRQQNDLGRGNYKEDYNEWNFGDPNDIRMMDPTIEKTLFPKPNFNNLFQKKV
jgi:hypothetical protein